ncbi:unnamed protein product [Rhizophagus irregularis]|nr:unnamed protein product [Rhizophagus irregularis]
MPPIRLEKPRSTRTAISVEVKKEICEYIVANPNVNQEREKWLAVLSTSQTPHIFHHRSVQFPELDKAMQIWTSQATAAGLPLTDMILQQKGKEFAKMLNIEDQLKCTNGWVYRFKVRNGLQKVNFSGEANSAPLETLPEERLRLRTLLAKYNEEDIYNADETGLFFRMEPNHTLGSGSHFNPKTFDEDSSDLSEDNEENVAESSHSAQSRTKSKKKVTKKKPNIKLTNIKLIYLPPNTTAHLQPMDAGIIHSFKSKYKQEFCKHLIQQFDNGIDQKRNKLNIKEAIDYIAEAWEDVTPTTIQNCWKKTGILPASDFLVDDSNMQDFEIDESDELDGINIDCLPENENDESDDDDSDEEILLVSEKQEVDALKIFINYFEQQNDPEFNIDDLRIFRKYLRIARIKEINSKKQSTLDMFLL